MRKALLLAIVFLTTFTAFGQDFSNKGKDFWVGYGYHTQMIAGNGNSQDMVLYFATDQVTNIIIKIPATGYTQNITTAAGNNVITSAVIPKTGAQDARLLNGGLSNNGIHITSDKPMVAYAHVYNGSCSGATILYPTNTLGREYYSVNYKNWSNQNNANCWFYVVAVDTGTTTIEITPQADQAGVVTTAASGSWTAGTTYTVNLTQGQIYNVMGILTTSANPFKGVDLTGSRIKSINNGTGCKKIGVFSGSGRISITCNASSSSSDNYMVQAMPKNAWGKKFLTTQANGNQANNIYRVCVSSPAAVVKINGSVTGLPLINNFYYEIPSTAQPQLIEADSAIMVAQYFTSQGACGNGNQPGDPEVIYLSPVEQNINKVIWYATPNFAITSHSLNVVIPNTGTALSSFKLNGAAVGGWVTHPQDPGYSYLRTNVGAGFNVIQSDSGFNAIAYGFGNAESYGYNAGTNIKDLYQQIGVQTTYGIETTPSVCTNSPFKFKVSLPYIPDSMHWDFHGAAGMSPNNNTVYINNTGNVAQDSMTVVNGRNIHWYSIPTTYTFSVIGVYPVTITTFVPNGECGSQQDIDFDLSVSDPPIPSFTWTGGGCVADSFHFVETTPQIPKTTYKFWWNFDDPGSGVNNDTSNVRNPVHLFSTPGLHRVKYGAITTPGCLSDTIFMDVMVPDIPNATIAGNSTPVCINSPTGPDVTFTASDGTAPYTFSYTINGALPAQTVNSIGTNNFVTIQAPTNVAGPFVYELVGVRNASPIGTPCTRNITGQTVTINITPDATVTLRPGDNDNQTVCINTPIVNIRYDIGGSGTGGSVSGLPAGVTGTYAGGVVTITGTPTVAGTFNYIVSTTGPCLTPQANGVLTVSPDHTISLTGGIASQTVCINTPISPITLTLGGGATGINPAGLPPGVTASVVGNIVTISGTPTSTAGSPYNYTLTTTGNSCVTANFTGAITVNPDHAIALTGGNPNQTVCVNVAITPFTLTLSGGATNIAAPVNLPPGVTATVVGNTVTISGTPTLAGSYPYSITTSGNSCLTANFTGTINVNPDHTISLTGGTASQTVCINTPISPITLTLGGGATGINPAGLPPGVTASVVGNIVTISGTPTSTAGSPYNYTLTTTGNSCVTANFTGAITVNPDHAIALAGGNPNQTVCVNVAITPFTLTLSGGANNIAAPVNLPPGVTANVVGNTVTISGTPTLAGSYPYSITTSGNSCLTANFTGTINVTADATIALTSAVGTDNQTVCRNVSIADIDYATGGSATGANITWVPSAPAGISFTPLGGGNFRISGTPTVTGTQTYTYTITTTGPCVKPAATGTITVNALPVAAFTVPPPSCANKTITFTNTSTPNAGPVTNWSWDFGDPNANAGNPNTSTAQSPTHYYILPGTYTATLHVVNANGCIGNPDASVTFVVNDTPRAGFIVPDVCINDVATVFTDTSKITVGSINRPLNEWDYGDPLYSTPGNPNTSIGQNGSHLYTHTGVYTVTQVVTSALGCKDTIRLPIIINSADPTANFTAGNQCSSDSVELVNLSTVGFGNVTRLEVYWDNVGAPGVFQTITAPAFNGIYRHKYPTSTTTQNYVIRMVAYSGVVCSGQKITPVTVYATPRVQFNNIPNTCYLVAPFQLTQGSEIGGVPGTGTYSGPGITNPNGTFNPQVAGIGTHAIKYTWTASNPGACIDTLTRFITVLDTAHATFSVSLPSCEQVPTSFTNLSTAPASVTLASTVWDFGDASGSQLFPIAAPITHTYAGPGTYTVTMHNISVAGCLSTDTTMQVTIDANHHIALTSGNSNQAVCVNNTITPIVYTLSGGASNVSIPALPAGLSYTVVGTTVTISGAPSSAAGSPYNFTVFTTGNTCQVASANISITVAPDHIITRNTGDSAQSVCVNSPIDPIVYDLGGGATGATITNLPPGVTYTVSGTTVTISGTPTTIAGGPTFNFAIQTTGNACVKANTIGQIKVNPYPVPGFTIDKPSYCIPNAVVNFKNTSTMPDLSPMTYNWNFGEASSGLNNVSSALDPSHWYSGIGPFNVLLSVRSTAVLNHNVIGCAHDTTIVINTIHPQPKADFVLSKPSVCIGDNVLITDATDGKDGIVNKWHWDLGDGTTEVTNPITHTYADTITYVITMYSVNSFGCNSDTINLLPLVGAPYKPFTVYPYPYVSAGPDKNVLEGGSVQLDATSYAREPQYTWSPADYLTDSKILNPRVMNPKTDMTYRLTVTGKGGCQLSDDVFVKLLRFPVIPNTFSPNGDGINDTWRIDYLNTYPDNRVQIFTRGGKLVFESRGYNTPWDGTIKGKPLPFDTYYYIIEPGNGRDPITGYITILK